MLTKEANSGKANKTVDLGDHNPTTAPLAGVRVLEAATFGAGPYAGSLLCGLGAEVVKVENPHGGDPMRGFGEATDGPNYMFKALNDGKASLALDYTHPLGAEALRTLLPKFDVFLTNSRAGALDRYGLGGKDCLDVNPRLVYVSMTGYGSDGPMAKRPAFDTVIQSMTGMFALYLESGDTPPNLPSIADLSAGVVTAAGVMAGLVGRHTSGRGVIIETSLLESMTAMLWDAFMRPPGKRATTRVKDSLIFRLRTADDRFVTVHLSTTEKFWSQLTAALDAPQLEGDPRFATYRSRLANWSELRQLLADYFVTKSSEEWESILDAAGIPFSRQLSADEASHHPQIEHLKLFSRDSDGNCTVFRGPWRVNGIRPSAERGAPTIGADSMAILSEALSEADIDRLRTTGIVGGVGSGGVE